MSDPLPMFDDPIPPAEPNPKKPRQKPMKKRANRAAKMTETKHVKKRRKKRARVKLPPTETKFPEVFLSPEVYKTIRTLVDLSSSERSMVLSIVKGLTNGRAD